MMVDDQALLADRSRAPRRAFASFSAWRDRRPLTVRFEQAVYGSFAFRDQGYAMLSASPGCRPEWLTDFRVACQNLGERPAGLADSPRLFTARLASGPWAIVGCFPQGRDDRGRPGALGFHGLFLDPAEFRKVGFDPFALTYLLRGDWTSEAALDAGAHLAAPEGAGESPGALDPRAVRIAGALGRGRRVAFESPAPIDGLARQTWRALPRRVRARATLATWAFGNANHFDLVAVPRLHGLELDRSYIDPLSMEGPACDEDGRGTTIGPSLWCSPWAIGVLGAALALALLGVGLALSGGEDAELPAPRADDPLPRASRPLAPAPRPALEPSEAEDPTDADPAERRRVAEALADLASRFELAAAGVNPRDDPEALMRGIASGLRYEGRRLNDDERDLLRFDAGPDALLALTWDRHVERFLGERPLPPDFASTPLRRQLFTLAWTFHAEDAVRDAAGPRRSASERAQALAEALAVDFPVRPVAFAIPALDDYAAFLGRLPRR